MQSRTIIIVSGFLLFMNSIDASTLADTIVNNKAVRTKTINPGQEKPLYTGERQFWKHLNNQQPNDAAHTSPTSGETKEDKRSLPEDPSDDAIVCFDPVLGQYYTCAPDTTTTITATAATYAIQAAQDYYYSQNNKGQQS